MFGKLKYLVSKFKQHKEILAQSGSGLVGKGFIDKLHCTYTYRNHPPFSPY